MTQPILARAQALDTASKVNLVECCISATMCNNTPMKVREILDTALGDVLPILQEALELPINNRRILVSAVLQENDMQGMRPLIQRDSKGNPIGVDVRYTKVLTTVDEENLREGMGLAPKY